MTNLKWAMGGKGLMSSNSSISMTIHFSKTLTKYISKIGLDLKAHHTQEEALEYCQNYQNKLESEL